MRISKEISGNAQERQTQARQGRGEYEICEEFGQLRPPDLFNRRIIHELPNGRLTDTGTQLQLQGGKRRIRLIRGEHAAYPHRQVAALLLMPKPSRAEPSWGDGTPVLRTGQYGVLNLELTNVVLEGPDRVRVAVDAAVRFLSADAPQLVSHQDWVLFIDASKGGAGPGECVFRDQGTRVSGVL